MNILITICARGGSKGIPGKNIKTLGGKPLIYYSLSTATKFASLVNEVDVDIVLSTDHIEIKNQVAVLGFNIDTNYTRPEFLATDTAGKVDAIQDVLMYAEMKNRKVYDYIIDLDVTSPLRTAIDIKEAYILLKNNTAAYNIFSVSPANRNPYFNMVEQNDNGFYSTCKEGAFLTRQSAPKVYDMNASFYIYKAVFFEQGLKKAITERSLIYEVPHICFDLDHPIDFEMMTFLLANNRLDFEI